MSKRDQEHIRSKGVHHHKEQAHEEYGGRTASRQNSLTSDLRHVGNAENVSRTALNLKRDAGQQRGLEFPFAAAISKHDSLTELMQTPPGFEPSDDFSERPTVWESILHPDERADEDWIS